MPKFLSNVTQDFWQFKDAWGVPERREPISSGRIRKAAIVAILKLYKSCPVMHLLKILLDQTKIFHNLCLNENFKDMYGRKVSPSWKKKKNTFKTVFFFFLNSKTQLLIMKIERGTSLKFETRWDWITLWMILIKLGH